SLAAAVELTRLGAGDVPSLYLPGQDELAAEIGAGLGQSRLSLGVVAIDGRGPRPSLRFEQGLRFALGTGDGEAAPGAGPTTLELALSARVNERSRDTP